MTDIRKICKICRRVLETTTRNGETVWAHHAQDSLTDHPATPVDPADFSPRGRCDFCNDDGPSFVLPAREFIIGRDMERDADVGSHGDWSACTPCAVLIEGNRWSALVRRVKERWEAAHGVPQPDHLMTANTRLYRMLRSNITGSLRPL